MDKNISDIFDYGDEIVVDWVVSESCDPKIIKELTMNKIQQENRRTNKKIHSAGRVILIAAAVAVGLVGGALAAYYGTMADRATEVQSEPVYAEQWNDDGTWELVKDETAEPETETRLNMNGRKGSPEYMAFEEWESWRNEYDVIAQMHAGNWEDEPDFPASYKNYGIGNAEMAAKIEEITEKYGLKLHEEQVGFDSAQELYDTLNTAAFLPETMFTNHSGYIYDDGTFLCSGWSDNTVSDCLFVNVNGYFTNISGLFPDEYEEWSYTTKDGTTVDLVFSDYAAYILAEFDNAVMTYHYGAGSKGTFWADIPVMTEEEYRSSLPPVGIYWSEDEFPAMYEEYYTATTVENEVMKQQRAESAIDKAFLENLADSIDFAVLAERFG